MAGAAVQARPTETPPLQLGFGQDQRERQDQQKGEGRMDGLDRRRYGGTAEGGGGKARWTAAGSNRRKTPYDRPVQGRHASGGPQAAKAVNGGAAAGSARAAWLGSGLVGTASKLLTSGASYLFSSVFGRRETAALALACEEERSAADAEEQEDDMAEASPSKIAVGEGQGRASRQRHVKSPELDALLGKRTITSEEFSRLTQLLQSRVVDKGVDKRYQVENPENEGTADVELPPLEFDIPMNLERQSDQRLESKEPGQNGSQHGAGRERSSIAAGVSEPNNGSESPIEIARAFMGDRVVRVPGATSPAPAPKSAETGPSRALISMAGTNDFSHNIFQTPQVTRSPRPPPGLSHTPYSRPVHGHAARELTIEASRAGVAPSRWTPIRAPLTGGAQNLKRRSTALDDGWASVGPIRRTRRKSLAPPVTSGSSQSRLFGPLADSEARPFKTPFQDIDSGVSGKRVVGESQGGKRKVGFASSNLTKADDRKGDSSGLALVPAQSTETARKILETLDRLTSSPKDKLLEEELAFMDRKPQGPLTSVMLRDHVRRSIQEPKFPLSYELGDSGTSGAVLGQVDERRLVQGPSKLKDKETETPSGLPSVGRANQAEEPKGLPLPDDGVLLKSAQGLPSSVKKDGFRMSADLEDLESDHEEVVTAPETSTEVKTAPGKWVGESLAPGKASSSRQTAGVVSESPSAPGSTQGKPFGGFTFPVSSTFENLVELPPTPKAIPSVVMNGGAAAETPSGLFFQFGAPAKSNRVVFSAFSGAEALSAPSADAKESQSFLSTTVAPSTPFPATVITPRESKSVELKSQIIGSKPAIETLPVSESLAPTPEASVAEIPPLQSGASVAESKTDALPFSSTSFVGTSFATSSPFAPVPSLVSETAKVRPDTQPAGLGFGAAAGTSSGFSFGLQAPSTGTFQFSSAIRTSLPLPTSSVGAFGHDFGNHFKSSVTSGEPGKFAESATVSTASVTGVGGVNGDLFKTSAVATSTSAPAAFSFAASERDSSSSAPTTFAASAPALFTFTSPSIVPTTPSTAASTPEFGSSSAASLFGASHASSSSLGMGASSSPAAASSPFGLSTGNLPAFPGFTKDSQPAKASTFGSGFAAAPYSFGAGTSATSSAFSFSANAAATGITGFGSGINPPTNTVPAAQPFFGFSSTSPAFGTTPVNGAMSADAEGDHTSMEEIVEGSVPAVASSAPLSIYQQPAATPPFVFGESSAHTGPPSAFEFSAQPNPFQAGVPNNPFSLPAGLDYGGGVFSLGSGGADQPKPGRKFIKAKRTGTAKRGK